MNNSKSLLKLSVIMTLTLVMTACAVPVAPVPEPPAAEAPTGEAPMPSECANGSVDFTSLQPGATYLVGDFFFDRGAVGVIQPFRHGSSNLYYDGEATVFDQSSQYMETNDGPYLWTNNVNLALGFSSPLNGVSFRFAYFGGTNNLEVNGDSRAFDDFTGVDGQQVGGVDVSVEILATTNNTEGIVTLAGTIQPHQFSVGGQELGIDSICLM